MVRNYRNSKITPFTKPGNIHKYENQIEKKPDSVLRKYCEDRIARGDYGHNDPIVAIAGRIEQLRIDLKDIYSRRTRFCAIVRDGNTDSAFLKIVDITAFEQTEEQEQNIHKQIRRLDKVLTELEPLVDAAIKDIPELQACPTIEGLKQLRFKLVDHSIRLERHQRSEVEKRLSYPKSKLDEVLKSPAIVELRQKTESQIKLNDDKIALFDKHIAALEAVME